MVRLQYRYTVHCTRTALREVSSARRFTFVLKPLGGKPNALSFGSSMAAWCSDSQVNEPSQLIVSPLCVNLSVISHTYGPMNGTSMAAPIVSGSAAMTLSLLGASDGNFFKASQVSDQSKVVTHSSYKI